MVADRKTKIAPFRANACSLTSQTNCGSNDADFQTVPDEKISFAFFRCALSRVFVIDEISLSKERRKTDSPVR